MKRAVDLSEISDGKLYNANDLVKAGCNDCRGCSDCCQKMGSSIILDPLDIHRLMINLCLTFEELLIDKIELNMVDGTIIPNLKMSGRSEICAFLNDVGRCSIHDFRPGICRLFPLGRYYEKHTFYYFLQVLECKNQQKTKVKIRKWIDTPNLKDNEQFIVDWHYFLLDMQEALKNLHEEQIKEVNMYVLKIFYLMPYEKDNFYQQFRERLEEAKKIGI